MQGEGRRRPITGSRSRETSLASHDNARRTQHRDVAANTTHGARQLCLCCSGAGECTRLASTGVFAIMNSGRDVDEVCLRDSHRDCPYCLHSVPEYLKFAVVRPRMNPSRAQIAMARIHPHQVRREQSDTRGKVGEYGNFSWRTSRNEKGIGTGQGAQKREPKIVRRRGVSGIALMRMGARKWERKAALAACACNPQRVQSDRMLQRR